MFQHNFFVFYFNTFQNIQVFRIQYFFNFQNLDNSFGLFLSPYSQNITYVTESINFQQKKHLKKDISKILINSSLILKPGKIKKIYNFFLSKFKRNLTSILELFQILYNRQFQMEQHRTSSQLIEDTLKQSKSDCEFFQKQSIKDLRVILDSAKICAIEEQDEKKKLACDTLIQITKEKIQVKQRESLEQKKYFSFLKKKVSQVSRWQWVSAVQGATIGGLICALRKGNSYYHSEDNLTSSPFFVGLVSFFIILMIIMSINTYSCQERRPKNKTDIEKCCE